MAAVQTAFTRALRKRFGQNVQIYNSSGSTRASRRVTFNLQRQQQQQYKLQPLQQQQLVHAGSGNSSSSLVGQQVVMQDVLPLQTATVQAWTLQQQQQQALATSTAAAAAVEYGDFVPATDDEDDYVVDDTATVDEDMSCTQFSTQPGSHPIDVTMLMQQ